MTEIALVNANMCLFYWDTSATCHSKYAFSYVQKTLVREVIPELIDSIKAFGCATDTNCFISASRVKQDRFEWEMLQAAKEWGVNTQLIQTKDPHKSGSSPENSEE